MGDKSYCKQIKWNETKQNKILFVIHLSLEKESLYMHFDIRNEFN